MIHCKPISRIYYNAGNGYTVASYMTDDELPCQVVRQNQGILGSFIAVGIELPVNEGLELEIDGDWKNNKKYGLQYEVSYYHVVIPETEEGIKAYLSSDLIKGIGPVTADRIVERFGQQTFYILNNTPEKLLGIPGISETRLEEILDGYHKSSSLRELMVYLGPMGVTPKKLAKIQEHFGRAALSIVKEDPFRLCEIKGFGFATVDPIAVKSKGFRSDNPLRIKAAIAYVLLKAQEEGHLYLTSEEVVVNTSKLLNHNLEAEEVTIRAIKDAGNEMIHKDHQLVGNAGGIYTKQSFDAEMGTAAVIVRLLQQQKMHMKVAHLLERVQKEESIILNIEQKEAICMVFSHPFSIITGGPGCGKTTIIRFIIRIQEILDKEAMILLCAPTGRARRRMYESTGYPAVTIQKAVGMTGQEGEEEWNIPAQLPDDLIIADECSMIDMFLANSFFGSIKLGTRVVLLGDKDQLESVGPGNVFKEMIESGVIPVTVLTECFRQEEDSTIINNARKVNDNRTDLIYDQSFRFYPAKSPEDAANIIKEIYEEKWLMLGKDVDAVQVLSPLRKDTAVGANALNEVLREVVNPKKRGVQETKNGQSLFREGDKVMQTKNNDEVANGDMGEVLNIYRDRDNNNTIIRVDFKDERVVEYSDDEYWPLTHAYATSIHKAQGSDYPIVIIPMLSCFKRMLRRNIMYTGITRAIKEVIIVGSKTAIAQAIHNNKTAKRNTKFGLRLRLLWKEMQQESRKSA